MDAVGITIGVTELAAISAALGGWWFWLKRRAKKTNAWPITEATIESGGLETVSATRYGKIVLPVFAFSYQVNGEYYSGRFALEPYITAPDASIVQRMIGRKLNVHYDPKRLEIWFMPDEFIEGCRIQQKLSPHISNYSLS